MREGRLLSSGGRISVRISPVENNLKVQSSAGEVILMELECRARMRGLRRNSASEGENPKRGEEEGLEEEDEEERELRFSRADLQAAVRLECFRHAMFLMIFSMDGERICAKRDWGEDIGRVS